MHRKLFKLTLLTLLFCVSMTFFLQNNTFSDSLIVSIFFTLIADIVLTIVDYIQNK